MNNKQPWKEKDANGNLIWKTESAYWSWMKGVFRRGWNKHPLKLEYLKQNRVRIPNPNPKGKVAEVWGAKCECCEQLFTMSQVEVNRKGDSAALTKQSDIQACVEKLLMVTFDQLEILCKDCHAIYSYSQKNNISFEEARIQKKVIAFMKQPVKEQLAYFKELGYDSSDDVRNVAKRRKLIEQIYKGEK